MKTIKLTNSDKVVIVDDEDFELLNNRKWHLDRHGYVRDRANLLHLYIYPSDKDGLETDHIDRNKLNNQRSNLRRVTRLVNVLNSGAVKREHRYIFWQYHSNKWRVQIQRDNKVHNIGMFLTLELAILERDSFLRKLGEAVGDAETPTKQE